MRRWYNTSPPSLSSHCNTETLAGTFEALGLKREEYGHNVMCAGGIQGYINGSSAYNEVLLPTIECAMRRECIAPEGAALYNHR